MTLRPTEGRLREYLLALSGFIAVGSVAELLLLLHFEEALQWIPFILCVLALAVVVAVWRRPGRRSIRALRTVMALVIAGSAWGVLLHLQGNLDFLRETKPNASAMDTVWGMVHGGSPVLAPGVLVVMALAGLAATYRHPALEVERESQPAA
jgi:hypothetical protein